MTDRKPDDLYDALRDRLADYGQEPPSSLWAGIRAELPPPVAQPQLRRRRRWAPVALLALLLTIGSGGAGWYWWQSRHSAGSISDASLATSTLSQLPAKIAGSPTTTSTINASSGLKTASPKAKEPNTVAVTTPQNRVDAVEESPLAPASASRAAATEKSVSQSTAATCAARHASKVPGLGMRRFALSAAASARRTKQASENALWAGVSNESGRNESRQLFARKNGRNKTHSAEREPAQANTNAAQFSSAAAKRSRNLIETQQDGASAAVPASSSASSAVVAAQNQRNAATSPAAASGVALGPTASERAAQTNILGRVVALQLAAWPRPASPQLVAVEQLPPPVVARWAVQATAGPALTYRYLQGAPAAGSSTGTPTVGTAPVGYYPVASANTIAELERPTLGGSAQVSARRTLTEHWSLSAGLGYAEYASALALQQVHVASTRLQPNRLDSASTTSIHRRDTYRFVTLPVQVGYGWTLSGRWRVGVQAGAEAAVYVGGSSTEGSTCACQSQTWSFANSPYRRVSMGASLGAEARYRISERWELLAQPTATYLLTSLARPATAYYPRHLFGGAALLGVSYDLP